jgi:hypothetical protein
LIRRGQGETGIITSHAGKLNSKNKAHDSDLAGIQAAMIDHEDFSVVVKNRANPPKPWRWEIYRAGRTSPIEHSQVYFETMSEANRAGKAALKLMLSEFQS